VFQKLKQYKWNQGRKLSHHKRKKGETVKQPTPSHSKLNSPSRAYAVLFRSSCSSLELITNEKFQITFPSKLKRCIFLRLIWLETFLNFIVRTHSQLPRALNIDHDKKEATNELIEMSRSRLKPNSNDIREPRVTNCNKADFDLMCCKRAQVTKMEQNDAIKCKGHTPPRGGKF
jgi:hypothetical protein